MGGDTPLLSSTIILLYKEVPMFLVIPPWVQAVVDSTVQLGSFATSGDIVRVLGVGIFVIGAVVLALCSRPIR